MVSLFHLLGRNEAGMVSLGGRHSCLFITIFHFQAAAARDTMHDNCQDLPEDLIRNALKITVLYRIQEKEV